MHRRAWIEIDAAALAHNARIIRRATPAAARLAILVKADGYGHGMLTAAQAALDGGADALMVATLDEGLELRAAGIDAPTLVVYPIAPDGVGDAVAADLELSMGGAEVAGPTLAAWAAARPSLGDRRLRVHVEVDTGMGRGGVASDRLLEVLDALDATPAVELAGVWSHLADGVDADISGAQVARYEAALAAIAGTGRPRPVRHVAATEGLFAGTAPAYDMVRVGLAFYGALGVDVEPAPSLAALAAELRPAMRVVAHPVRVETIAAGGTVGYGGEWTADRPSRVATLPIGYADGWSRRSWPGGEVLVRGRRMPLVGRVSMDSVCVDVTAIVGVSIDDEVVLLGRQDDEEITATEIARFRGSIPNEVFCALGPRRLDRRSSGQAER
ncbi:MAG: alanine racemase [Candidatus Limnocylindria bacterium]